MSMIDKKLVAIEEVAYHNFYPSYQDAKRVDFTAVEIATIKSASFRTYDPALIAGLKKGLETANIIELSLEVRDHPLRAIDARFDATETVVTGFRKIADYPGQHNTKAALVR